MTAPGSGGAGVELEAKYSAWPGFEVPDLEGCCPGLVVVPGPVRVLDAVYHDTDDLRLIRDGVTVRRRSDADAVEWTVKFPRPSTGDVLRRREVDLALDDSEPPPPVQGLVRGWVRCDDLVTVAHLRTRRRSHTLEVDGVALGTIDDDEVSVLDGDRVAARFREVEVEVASDEAEPLLAAVGARLVDAGAGAADPTPKLVRALGPRALRPPDLAPVELGDDPTTGEVVRAAIVASVRRVVTHDHVIRLDDDIEGVHQARVGTRRLRSDLRTFRTLVDRDWSEPLRDELRWLAAELGRVRDADVLVLALHDAVAGLPDRADRDAGAPIVERAIADRRERLTQLLEVLDGDRYVTLLERLVDAADRPRLVEADRRATDVLAGLVRRPWKRLRRDAEALEPDAPDAAYHRLRIDVKRVRYAAEAVAPVVGDDARSLARALAAAQDLLGDHQDAAVAEAWLRAAVADGPPAQALVAGQLVATRRMHAQALRDAWPAAWVQVARKEHTRWLR